MKKFTSGGGRKVDQLCVEERERWRKFWKGEKRKLEKSLGREKEENLEVTSGRENVEWEWRRGK